MPQRRHPLISRLPPIRVAAGAALVAAALSSAGCATAPARAPGPSTELPHMLCGEGMRQVDLQAIGLPHGEPPRDVALGAERIWVLAEPRTLLELPRDGEGPAQILRGRADTPAWRSLTVDRDDGSLWIVSGESFDLLHFDPNTGHVERVTVGRAAGEGGFSEIAAGDGVFYLAPTCTEHGVWTVSPKGELLDRALPLPALPADATEAQRRHRADYPCSYASLAVGPGGATYATSGAVYRATPEGWREDPALRPTQFEGIALQGLDIGQSSEVWFWENTGDFFFIDGEPAWLGGAAMSAARERQGTILFRRDAAGRLHPYLEPCLHWVRGVASDENGYALLTDRYLFFGGGDAEVNAAR